MVLLKKCNEPLRRSQLTKVLPFYTDTENKLVKLKSIILCSGSMRPTNRIPQPCFIKAVGGSTLCKRNRSTTSLRGLRCTTELTCWYLIGEWGVHLIPLPMEQHLGRCKWDVLKTVCFQNKLRQAVTKVPFTELRSLTEQQYSFYTKQPISQEPVKSRLSSENLLNLPSQ